MRLLPGRRLTSSGCDAIKRPASGSGTKSVAETSLATSRDPTKGGPTRETASDRFR